MSQPMTCSTCQKRGWPDPQQSVWTDDKGNGLCVFHAPAGEKRKSGSDFTYAAAHSDFFAERYSVEEFNQCVFRRIDEVIAKQGKDPGVKCYLSSTTFPGDISFAQYNSSRPLPNIDFENSLFSGKLDFVDEEPQDRDVKSHSVFYGTAVFTDVHFAGYANFNSVEFHGECSFRNAKFSSTGRFNKAKFFKKADFGWIKAVRKNRVLLLNLDSASLANLCVSEPGLVNFTFRGCDWPEALGIETTHTGEKDEKHYRECEELYRALKVYAEKNGDKAMMSHWHAREKLTNLKQALIRKLSSDSKQTDIALWLNEAEDRTKRRWRRIWPFLKLAVSPPFGKWRMLSWWYWLSSGYGEHPGRAAILLILLALLPFFTHSVVGNWLHTFLGISYLDEALAKAGAIVDAKEALRYIPFSNNIMGMGSPSPADQLSGWDKVGQGIWQLLILIQTALFAMAVRNRLRR